MGIKIGIGELPQVLSRKFDAVKKAAVESVTNTAELGVAMSVHQTSSKAKPGGKGVGAVDRGLFKNSWHHRTFPDRAEIFNNAPYAAVIEFGSRPHTPPLGPLIAWVRRKRKDLGIEEADVFRVAKAIQRKIAREGTAPMFIAKDLLPDLKKELNKDFKRRIAAVARQK